MLFWWFKSYIHCALVHVIRNFVCVTKKEIIFNIEWGSNKIKRNSFSCEIYALERDCSSRHKTIKHCHVSWCLQIMWFRMGNYMWLKKEDLLWNIWLCCSWNLRRNLIRYVSRSLVFGNISIWNNGGESSILSYKQKVNNEKNNECNFFIYLVLTIKNCVSFKYVKIS